MIAIKKFLCCIELEKACRYLGLLSGIGFGTVSSLFLVITVYGWIIDVSQPSQNLWHQLIIMLKPNWFFFVYMFYCSAMSDAGFRLVRGIEKRDYKKFEKFLNMTPFGIFASIIYIGSIVPGGAVYIPVVFLSIVGIHWYIFLAVFSLHRRYEAQSPTNGGVSTAKSLLPDSTA